jgi:hypothetical protein
MAHTRMVFHLFHFLGFPARAERGKAKPGGRDSSSALWGQGVGSRKEPLKLSRLPKSGGQSVSGDGALIGDPSMRDCR